MKIKILFATLIAFALAAAGCSSLDPESGRSHLGYIPARFYDLLDIVELNVGFNPGINSYIVGAIEPLAVGVGHYRSEKYGMDGRLLGHWKKERNRPPARQFHSISKNPADRKRLPIRQHIPPIPKQLGDKQELRILDSQGLGYDDPVL